jgi:hypothetical protein
MPINYFSINECLILAIVRRGRILQPVRIKSGLVRVGKLCRPDVPVQAIPQSLAFGGQDQKDFAVFPFHVTAP